MKRIGEAIGLLKKSGYVFLHCEHGNALFVRDDISQPKLTSSSAGTRSERVLASAK
jgi:hypothetical protein